MFFKKLELYGFKSFATKTKLDFEAGVTAIVGPNGCGKSNIADAIKWVLGEQSVQSLRGAAMEDIIFHGAGDIPPVGFAEVTLTISNQNKDLPLDYEEMAITRRIFRSGESEYLINKVPVRLKDILELLMGTGLGVRSYSLMEQGRVDQILSSRPQDRREIFEEASDITKYKSRREEALRKLERTQENIQRLGDIIVEVKRQINSMERQVNKARRYKQEFEKLKEYELQVSQYQYQNLKKERKELESAVSALEKQESSLNSRMAATAQTLQKAKDDLACAEQEMSEVQAQSYEVEASVKTGNSQMVLDQERAEELSNRCDDIKQQIQDLERKIAASGEQIKQIQGKIASIEQEKEEKSLLLKTREEDINTISNSVKEIQKKISEDKTRELEITAQQANVKNDLTKLETNLANLNARLRRLNIECERTEEEFNLIEEKHKNCVEQLQSQQLQLKQLNKEIWDFRSNLDIELEKRHKLTHQREEFDRQETLLQSKLDLLKEMTSKYEGFSSGVRSIFSENKGDVGIDGLCDVLANLIEALPPYQLAIEMALGENTQAIVVEERRAAVDAINYLKAKEAGRARFICLDSLNSTHEKEIRLPQVLGRAQDFVKVEPKYQKALNCLLANTFIVEDMDLAQQILKNVKQTSVKLVTLDGEILTKTSINGGSPPKNLETALLGRRERITASAEKLEKMKKEKAELESLITAQESEVEELKRLVDEREPGLNKLKIELANKESEKSNIESERKRFEDEISVLKLDIDEAGEGIQQFQADKENLCRRLTRFQEKQKETQEGIQNYQGLMAEKGQEKQNALVEIAETKTRLLSLDREVEDAQIQYKMVVDSETEQKNTQKLRQQEIESTVAKIDLLRQQIQQHKLESQSLTQNKQKLQEKLTTASQQHKKLLSRIKGLESQAGENQKELNDDREKRANFQVKLTEFNYKQSSLKDKIQQSYSVDLETTLADAVEISPPQESTLDEINRLKSKIEGIGPVNLVAIEENDQLQQRYSFLISQQKDLTSAQESLRKAITQINRTARQTFVETFQKIQVSFKEYFRILFGGGDARLILIEENNVLESGIEIVARPPGKKLQNISLLSGGEKALTAIALLFSIFKVKPSPFCILDEVDAPLDEANVDRFTNLLSEFVKTSQFIIITHNKKTINIADIMYGITMARSGISKIVSVRFTDEESAPAREMARV